MQNIAKILKNNIKALGSISLKEFMSLALYHPNLGYYNKKNIIGSEGDFITAPEISQVFGELLANWIIINSKNLLKNSFNYLELGPGLGTLSQDIIRTIKKLDKNLSGKIKSIYFLEKSSSFIYKLKKKYNNAFVINELEELEKRSTIIIANEFFDAIPVNQYIKIKNLWYERRVSLDANDNFIFVISSKPSEKSIFFPRDKEEGYIFEHSEYSDLIISKVCKFIFNNGGAFLIFDYAREKNNSSTLTAINNHKHVNPFYKLGKTDLSIKPDFHNIKKIAQSEQCKVIGPLDQSYFLEKLGIHERINILINNNPQYKNALISQKKRLLDHKYMGKIFKVLLITNLKSKDEIFDDD